VLGLIDAGIECKGNARIKLILPQFPQRLSIARGLEIQLPNTGFRLYPCRECDGFLESDWVGDAEIVLDDPVRFWAGVLDLLVEFDLGLLAVWVEVVHYAIPNRLLNLASFKRIPRSINKYHILYLYIYFLHNYWF
jgi:hypothetical protein